MIRPLLAVLLSIAAIAPCAAQEKLSHGFFRDVSLYRPEGEVTRAVLLLSDAQGWDARTQALAQALAVDGAFVAGIDTAKLRKAFIADGGTCTFPAGDLENLSHYLQGYARLPGYRTPVLVGVGAGGSIAYAMSAKAQPAVFAGAVTTDFNSVLDWGKPPCKDQAALFKAGGSKTEVELLPVTSLTAPWVALADHAQSDAVRAFQQGMKGAATGRNPSERGILAATRVLGKTSAVDDTPPAPGSLKDLPLIEVKATAAESDTYAMLLSGDGGWAGLDKDVAAALAAKGIPVVGFDSLRYFWTPRKPEGLAKDLDRVLRYYGPQWKKKRVLLLGYSQGADVLPFAINRLPAATRAQIAQTVLMGLGEKASFEFHVTNWMSRDDDGLPILPEASKLTAVQTLCVKGEGDKDSLCDRIPPGHVQVQSLPGGHHFGGDYDRLAEVILRRVPAAP
ncbi:MAG: AcvB/VirJ family lysyl-phosphatidylglycerol hydrolase [Pseudoxanthomonas sp.]